MSIGSDGAGSVRIPAAFCGNFGFKGSFGRVPAHPLSPFGTVSHIGPHTMSVCGRSVDDERAEAARRARLDGASPGPIRLLGRPRRRHRRAPRSSSRRRSATPGVDPEVADAVAAAAKQLEALGAHVEEGDPGFDDPLPITTGLWFTGAWTLWNNLTPAQQEVDRPRLCVQKRGLGAELTNLEVQRLILRRGELGSMMRQLMQRYDLVVTPSVAVPAFEDEAGGAHAVQSRVDARLDTVLVPVQPHATARVHDPVRSDEWRAADRVAARGADVRRRPRAPRRPRLRNDTRRSPARRSDLTSPLVLREITRHG